MSRNIGSLAALLAAAQAQGLNDLSDEAVINPPDTTVDVQLARALVEIEKTSEGGASPESIQFAKELVQFVADKAKALNVSGHAFGSTFGSLADVQYRFHLDAQSRAQAVPE